MLEALIQLAKKVPLDLGQGNLRFVTRGKVIAQELVPAPREPGKSRALDLGCREGAQSRWLESRGYRVTSADVEKVYDRAEVVDADEPLPYPDASFELVWSSEVLEHLADPARSLAELRRVLEPGGTLVVTTPNSHAWFYRLFAHAGLPPEKLQHPGHKHFFHERDVRRLFPGALVCGYFPYLGYKPRIERAIGWLTPTFVIVETSR